jgi:hypothetical protein
MMPYLGFGPTERRLIMFAMATLLLAAADPPSDRSSTTGSGRPDETIFNPERKCVPRPNAAVRCDSNIARFSGCGCLD